MSIVKRGVIEVLRFEDTFERIKTEWMGEFSTGQAHWRSFHKACLRRSSAFIIQLLQISASVGPTVRDAHVHL